MSKRGIVTQLTPDQKALIPLYRQKWQRIALSTEPNDCKLATETIKAIYTEINLPEPDVIFFDNLNFQAIDATNGSLNPGEILAQIDKKLNELWQPLTQQLAIPVLNRLESELILNPNDELRHQDWFGQESLWCEIWREWLHQISSELGNERFNSVSSTVLRQLEQFNIFSFWYELAEFGSYYDFCISVLNCEYDRHKWELYQALVKYCGWIFPFSEFCLVGDRPSKLSVDASLRLHAEGEPAITFSNGFSVYAYHGVRLPEKYEKHPHQWQAKWLLAEKSAEIRRVLIQGIGYDKICQEFPVTELDVWQEYTLLRIDLLEEIEPIHLLKTNCSSIGLINFLRVPPNIKTAREAISWENGGVDTEEFAFET